VEKLPYAGVLLAVLGMTVWARVHFAGTFDPPVSLDQFGWGPRAMQAFYLWAYYLWKPLWPVDLAPVYTTLVWFKPTDPAFVASAVGVMAITVALVWNRRRWPALLAWWVGYLVMLGPVLGLTEHPHYPSDRYSYLATIPWSVLLAGALARCWHRLALRSVMLGVLVAASGVAVPLSAWQTRTWHDSETLFNHVLRTLGENRYRGDIHWRLGLLCAQHERWAEAAGQFRSALRYLPMFAEAHDGLAAACEAQGKPEEAAEHFAAAIRIRPTAERHAALAANSGRRGRTAEAIPHYRAALAIQPDAPAVLNNLAWALATARDSSQRNGLAAVQLAERACSLTAYQEPMLVGTLAAAYAKAGRFPDAVQTAQKAAGMAAAKGQREVQQKNLELLRLYRSGRSIAQAEADGVR
jgi:Flp pilus assembly protein TadD